MPDWQVDKEEGGVGHGGWGKQERKSCVGVMHACCVCVCVCVCVCGCACACGCAYALNANVGG